MSETVATPLPESPTDRAGRAHILAFVADAESEAVLRLGLASADPEGLNVIRGTSRNAIQAMKKTPSPRVLIVDISGDQQPITTLTALSEVVEPDVRVLVIGDRQDLDLYRQLTRNLGVAEYLYKPLNAEVVAQHFGPLLAPGRGAGPHMQGGRLIVMTGVCGGAGTTTLAASLAWYLANEVKRHTVLVDTNLYTGGAAMLVGTKAGSGLRLALEMPNRVDDLFMERIAEPAGGRLSVISAEEKLTEQPTIAPGAARNLTIRLRQRFNYLIAEVPLLPAPWNLELLDLARQRVLVMTPTLQAVRDVLRATALPVGALQTRRSLIVLNNFGAPGTLTKHEVETALECKVDVTVPYLPRLINQAATMGKPAAENRGPFRTAIAELARAVAAVGSPSRPAGLFARLSRSHAA